VAEDILYACAHCCIIPGKMKKIINLLLIVIAGLSIVSCSIKKQPASKPLSKYDKYDRHTVSDLSKRFGIRLTPANNIRLYDACSSWLGVRYRYGGNTKKGVDCSGFVLAVYKQAYDIGLERTTANMLRKNCIPIKRNNLREGDLVFFKTTGTGNRKTPTHVGIYLKNGRFIHASSSRGVAINSLSETYYIRAWLTGGRVKGARSR
jgi:lipoprotein Spr